MVGLATALAVSVFGLVTMLIWIRSRPDADVKERTERANAGSAALRARLEGLSAKVPLSRVHYDAYGHAAIAFAGSGSTLVLLTGSWEDGSSASADQVKVRTVKASQILDVDLREDSYTRQGKTVADASFRAVGLDLRVFLADPADPVVVLGFLDKDVKFGGKTHRAARREADAWQALLKAQVAQSARSGEPDARIPLKQVR